MKSAGKARSNGLYRHIRTSKEIIRNLLNDYMKNYKNPGAVQLPCRDLLIQTAYHSDLPDELCCRVIRYTEAVIIILG